MMTTKRNETTTETKHATYSHLQGHVFTYLSVSANNKINYQTNLQFITEKNLNLIKLENKKTITKLRTSLPKLGSILGELYNKITDIIL